jgi:hypothetical protein
VKKLKGSIALLVAVVLALGTIGVGYAVWTESITVHGIVTTGKLAWEFSGFNVVDSGGATITPSYSTDMKTLQIDVTNTYPGWVGKVTIQEKNTGTVPLKFSSFQVIVDSQADSLWDYYYLAFLATSTGPINYGPYTLHAIQLASPVYYSALDPGYPTGYTIPVGGTHDSTVQLSLDSSLVGNYDSTINFRFIHTATVSP